MNNAFQDKNNLATTHPHLASEWHSTKNGASTPDQFTYGSNKKVWWECINGHEWQATICSRSSGGGCPTCIKERHTSFPEQAIFYYLNQIAPAYNRFLLDDKTEIDIYVPTFRVGVEYDGSKWHQNPTKDLKKNYLCKQQGIRLIRVREPNCPPISSECILLSSLDMSALTVAIQKLCALLGASLDIDIDRDQGAIYSQYIEYQKQNNLAVKFPDLAAEWHPTKNGKLKPEYVLPGTHKKVWWVCEKGHEWQMKINNRTSSLQQKCPVCANQQVLVGYNDLATTHPELANEWHPTKNGILLPSDVLAGTDKKVWWLGSCGHEWDMAVSKRALRNHGCPYCSNHRLLPGFNDLATVRPDLAAQWHPTKNGDLTPAQVLPGAETKVWWVCEHGHEWPALVCKRNSGRGCPICANKQILRGYNDLSTVNPALTTEWHPTKNGNLFPSDVALNYNKKVWWQCSQGHEWQATPNSRARGNGCPICSGHRVLSGFNDLATTHPELAAEWHSTKNGALKPTDVTAGSNKKKWWLGKCGHEWEMPIHKRTSQKQGCPYCSGHRVLIGFNDLGTTHPELAAEWHPTMNGDLTPDKLSKGSGITVWWLCPKGHEYQAAPNRRTRGNGCPMCAERNPKKHIK